MKNYSLSVKLVLCCAFGLMLSPSYAQVQKTQTPAPAPTATPAPLPSPTPTLTMAQLDAIVTTDLSNCSSQSGGIDPASIIPASNAQTFPTNRISKTLHGIWQGQVIGDNNELVVDYYWIVDVPNSQALIVAQRTGKATVAPPPQGTNPPKLSFLMCPNEGYIPNATTPQIHQFVKVSDSIAGAAGIVQQSTGLQPPNPQPTLSDLWQALVASGYFNSMPAVAFAGGFFTPLQLQPVTGPTGLALVSLQWNAEYRGGGATGIKYTPGVPMEGTESAQFVGTSTDLGDFLVASSGNGTLWKVQVVSGGKYNLGFDKVVLGPLEIE